MGRLAPTLFFNVRDLPEARSAIRVRRQSPRVPSGQTSNDEVCAGPPWLPLINSPLNDRQQQRHQQHAEEGPVVASQLECERGNKRSD